MLTYRKNRPQYGTNGETGLGHACFVARSSDPLSSRHLLLALCIQRVVHDELPLKHVMVAQTERTKPFATHLSPLSAACGFGGCESAERTQNPFQAALDFYAAQP